MNKIINDFLAEIDKRNSHEPEFMQAVKEVSDTDPRSSIFLYCSSITL